MFAEAVLSLFMGALDELLVSHDDFSNANSGTLVFMPMPPESLGRHPRFLVTKLPLSAPSPKPSCSVSVTLCVLFRINKV